MLLLLKLFTSIEEQNGFFTIKETSVFKSESLYFIFI